MKTAIATLVDQQPDSEDDLPDGLDVYDEFVRQYP